MNTLQDNKLVQTQFEHAAMVTKLVKPGHTILQSLDPRKCHIEHMCIGIVGELFELAKALDACHPADVQYRPVEREHIVEELGDVEFYVQGALQSEYLADFVYNSSGSCYKLELFAAAELILDGSKRLIQYDKKDKGLPKIQQGLNLLRTMLDYTYRRAGITKQEALEANLNKLLVGPNARYKEGTYSNDQAVGRADKSGADA